jgi:uncharacterized repeat protein (TIGR01451 family)
VLADLSVTKTVSSATPIVGTNVTFTVTLANLGPNTATGIGVTDLLPTGYTFVSHVASAGTYVSGTGVWTVASLAAPLSETLQIVATVNPSGVYTNTATLSASTPADTTPGNNSAASSTTPIPSDDADGDGIVNALDIDDDNDGMLDTTEGTADTDGDGIINSLDPDSDNDNISDNVEGQTTAGFVAPSGVDANGDGLDDAYDPSGVTPTDTDGDTVPDYLDTDADGDGILDSVELTGDPDSDLAPNFRDLDSDGDGIPDVTEGLTDTDGDSTPDYLDLDADNDGIPDATEGSTADSDGDGVPDYLEPEVPGIAYYDPTYGNVLPVSSVDAPLYLQARAGVCNRDPNAIDTTPVQIVSSLTGDVEIYIARETAISSGEFRILPDVPTRNADKVLGNDITELRRNDRLTATLTECGGITTTILIDPSGVVFDSVTGDPVVGATVRLIDVGTGALATVFDLNGNPAPSTVVTGADGLYSFPRVAAGTYRLVITPPAGYSFPSVVPRGDLDPSRVVVDGSYGATFEISPATGAVTIDVPLDPGKISISKTASSETIEIADLLDYTVTVKNEGPVALTQVRVVDHLPLGFRYQAGSARRDGNAIADPTRGSGATLTFDIGNLAKGEEAKITYRVKVGPGAMLGDGTNSAQARNAEGTVVSNVARKTVMVQPGVFSDRAFILGKVFMDCNFNRIQDDEELGIPGVRLYLEDGTFVVSDTEGKYSFYGLRPITHVLKLDTTTMPVDAQLVTTANRNAGDPQSLFVDLKGGELHRADFATDTCTEEVEEEVRARREQGHVRRAEVYEITPVAPEQALPGVQKTRRLLDGSILEAPQGRILNAQSEENHVGDLLFALPEASLGEAGESVLPADVRRVLDRAPEDARLMLELPEDAVANGQIPVNIGVRVEDADGQPIAMSLLLTLEASHGAWEVDDLDEVTPGVQTVISDGTAMYRLLGPQMPATSVVRVSSGRVGAEGNVFFQPDLRPMIAVGLVEGVFNFHNLDLKNLSPAREADGFEEALRTFAESDGDGKTTGAARAALFLKGKVKGEYLLTLAYDSERQSRERLFRDIQPEAFYPVYGDAALRGYDAQSTRRLYVRLDKGNAYLLYGDFNTRREDRGGSLGTYSRSLTGGKWHYQNNWSDVNLFASDARSMQEVDEMRALGISGPYQLNKGDILENSEKVEIVVKDRNHPEVIVQSTPQTRFADYDLELLTGRILFRRPVPSVDEQLNPVFVRVSYEVRSSGDRYWVYGANARVKLHERLTVGGGIVEDENPFNEYRLWSGDVTLKLGERTTLMGEIAQSDDALLGTGNGTRVELRHDGETIQASAFTGTTDTNFVNKTGGIAVGRQEVGARVGIKIDEKTQASAEATHTEDLKAGGGERRGYLARLSRAFGESVQGELRLRYADQTAQPSQVQSVDEGASTSLGVKLSAKLPNTPEASVYAEYEQDVEDTEKRLAGVGGEYRFADRGRFYGRYEFISSLNGRYALNSQQDQNTAVVGLDTSYMKDGQVFNEYRVRDSISGRDAEASIGLRNLWNVAEGLRLHTTFERLHSMGGETNESTSATGAIEYTPSPLWKGTGRLEFRFGDQNNTVVNSFGVASKLDRDWTFLGRNLHLNERQKGVSAGLRIQNRAQLGVAYRDTDTNRLNSLLRFEHKYDRNEIPPSDTHRQAAIVSGHLNYHPERSWFLSGRSAAKWVDDWSDGLTSRYAAYLVGGRVIYDITERWDVGVIGNLMFDRGYDSHQYGLGAEVGYLLGANMWLSGGYNWFGFEDEDFDPSGEIQRGGYLRLRLKFDERLFEGDERAENALLLPNTR